MSYSLNTTCYACKKQDACTDQDKVQAAIDKIHENCLGEGGHLGSGTILIQCQNMDSKHD